MLSPTNRYSLAGRIPVSVQWRGRPAANAGRAARRQWLAAHLRRVLDDEPCLHVWWDTLSSSAQTVEASVDTAEFDRVATDLRRHGLRVDQIQERQVV